MVETLSTTTTNGCNSYFNIFLKQTTQTWRSSFLSFHYFPMKLCRYGDQSLISSSFPLFADAPPFASFIPRQQHGDFNSFADATIRCFVPQHGDGDDADLRRRRRLGARWRGQSAAAPCGRAINFFKVKDIDMAIFHFLIF